MADSGKDSLRNKGNGKQFQLNQDFRYVDSYFRKIIEISEIELVWDEET